jgi:hypothetical protein
VGVAAVFMGFLDVQSSRCDKDHFTTLNNEISWVFQVYSSILEYGIIPIHV